MPANPAIWRLVRFVGSELDLDCHPPPTGKPPHCSARPRACARRVLREVRRARDTHVLDSASNQSIDRAEGYGVSNTARGRAEYAPGSLIRSDMPRIGSRRVPRRPFSGSLGRSPTQSALPVSPPKGWSSDHKRTPRDRPRLARPPNSATARATSNTGAPQRQRIASTAVEAAPQ